MPIEVGDLVTAAKRLPAPLQWLDADQRRLEAVSALDIDGVTVEGLQLRLVAQKLLPDRAVSVLLLHKEPRSKYIPLWRLEWRPIAPHNNKNTGPDEYRMLQITGSHHHPYHLNLTQNGRFLRSGNLPIVVPIEPEPADFASFVAFAGKALNIADMGAIAPPPWEGLLL